MRRIISLERFGSLSAGSLVRISELEELGSTISPEVTLPNASRKIQAWRIQKLFSFLVFCSVSSNSIKLPTSCVPRMKMATEGAVSSAGTTMASIALSRARCWCLAIPPTGSFASHKATMCAPFRKTRYGSTTQSGSFLIQDGNVTFPPMHSFLLTLPRFKVRSAKWYVSFWLCAALSVFRNSPVLIAVLLSKCGSVQLHKIIALILRRAMMLAVDQDRWSPNWKWCIWILILDGVLFQIGTRRLFGTL